LFAEGIYGISPKGWDRYSKENHPAFLGAGQVLQSAGVQDKFVASVVHMIISLLMFFWK
jgi:hypothetical protein